MVKMTDRQKRKAKKKRERTKKWAPRKRFGMGLLIGYTLILSMFVIVSFAGVGLDTLKTTNSDFNVNFMGLSIKSPYDASKKVVIFSDQNCNPYIDGTMTTWKETDLEYWDAFEMDREGLMPKFLKYGIDVGSVGSTTGWVNAPREKYWRWAVGNSWDGMGCSVDPDSKNSGVPNLAISYMNLYPSDSNGNLDETYDYQMFPRTLKDSEGNSRDLEIHAGFVTLEYQISVSADYYIHYTSGGRPYNLFGEVGGEHYADYDLWTCFGTGIDFEAVFRIQVASLRFDDDWQLNPDWVNLGNGILQVNRRGFGAAIDTEGDEYTVVTKDTSNWKYKGKFDDIEGHQNEVMQKYSSKESAIDKSDVLTDDHAYVVDFKEQNPETVYVSMQYYIDLGLNYDTNWLGLMKDGTIQIQKIVWNQKITVQFYTSVCEPLGGGGIDPVTVTVTLPDDPIKDRIWDKIVAWLAEFLGVREQTAELILIACIIGVSIIIILILLAIFAPSVLPMVGKAIAGVFKRRAAARAARK